MNGQGILYLVATPIGNLKDITLRALEILKSADWIACEDTRTTKKLLSHYEVHARVTSFHDHSGEGKMDFVMRELSEGRKVAYVTDGGTPAVSDPGFTLVRKAVEQGIRVEAVPGPTALVSALVGSGIPCEKFTFEGFLPYKEGAMRNALERLKAEKRTMVFYESPYRILKTLRAMAEIFGERKSCVARELTKQFEEYVRGRLPEVLEEISKRKKLGEIVIVVEGVREEEKSNEKI